MILTYSPNDSVFFLHHCFVDKVWADWQTLQRSNNLEGQPYYAPEAGGLEGHNIDDRLKPRERTIRQVLDVGQLGYGYEPAAADTDLVKRLALSGPLNHFQDEWFPFAAN